MMGTISSTSVRLTPGISQDTQRAVISSHHSILRISSQKKTQAVILILKTRAKKEKDHATYQVYKVLLSMLGDNMHEYDYGRLTVRCP